MCRVKKGRAIRQSKKVYLSYHGLGFVVSTNGVSAYPEKTIAIEEWPKTSRDVRLFLRARDLLSSVYSRVQYLHGLNN